MRLDQKRSAWGVTANGNLKEGESMKGRQRRETVIINGIERIVPPEVTFRDFASLAKRKGWTPEYLAEKFRGEIEGPSEFFHRCLSGKPEWSVVIQYRSVLDLYWRGLSPLIEEESVRFCICGCQRRVYGRKQYASGYCRLKSHRQRSQNIKRGSEKAA